MRIFHGRGKKKNEHEFLVAKLLLESGSKRKSRIGIKTVKHSINIVFSI